MKIIDLYSGLGGASEAFVLAGADVMRCENNPLLLDTPDTWKWDLSQDAEVEKLINMPYWDNADLIWASPPCLEFSNAFNAPKPTAAREGRPFFPDLTLVQNAITIIEAKTPRYWIIENVVGAIKDFAPILGEPRQIIGAFVLWGNFPQIITTLEHTKAKADVWSTDPLRANKKALIPLQLSQAVRDAVMTPTLDQWIE